MRTTITLAVAALLNSAVLAYEPGLTSYKDNFSNNTNIPYNANLNETCTACIRAGFDACVYATGDTPGSVQTTKCNMLPTDPEIQDPVASGKPNGWFCSYGAAAQTNAIVLGCRPRQWQDPANNKTEALCGDYFIDLTNDDAVQYRAVGKLPLYHSCTYRVYSSCGYPSAFIELKSAWMQGDFDVAYSSASWNFNQDFDLFPNRTHSVDWSGSFLTAGGKTGGAISEGEGKPKLATEVLQKCDSANRNLYLTITRIKETPKPNATETFLSEEREMQTLTDFYLAFYSDLGTGAPTTNAKVLGAISFALFAALSVFAF